MPALEDAARRWEEASRRHAYSYGLTGGDPIELAQRDYVRGECEHHEMETRIAVALGLEPFARPFRSAEARSP